MKKSYAELFLYTIGSLLIGLVIKGGARKAWDMTQSTPIPDDPTLPQIQVRDTLIWTLSLALITGTAKFFYKKHFHEKLL